MRTKYKFSHRDGGVYCWRAPGPVAGYEELVTCSYLWFWGFISTDTSLPHCDGECGHAGKWGGSGIMPPDHVLVKTQTRQYLAHKKWGSEKEES